MKQLDLACSLPLPHAQVPAALPPGVPRHPYMPGITPWGLVIRAGRACRHAARETSAGQPPPPHTHPHPPHPPHKHLTPCHTLSCRSAHALLHIKAPMLAITHATPCWDEKALACCLAGSPGRAAVAALPGASLPVGRVGGGPRQAAWSRAAAALGAGSRRPRVRGRRPATGQLCLAVLRGGTSSASGLGLCELRAVCAMMGAAAPFRAALAHCGHGACKEADNTPWHQRRWLSAPGCCAAQHRPSTARQPGERSPAAAGSEHCQRTGQRARAAAWYT